MIAEIVILALSVPVGFLISWLARDELVSGRKWFRILVIVSVIGGIWFWLIGENHVSLTLGFIFFIALIGLIKSDDKKWVRKT